MQSRPFRYIHDCVGRWPSLVMALLWGSRDHRFESCAPDSVMDHQAVEESGRPHIPRTEGIEGSNPARLTMPMW